MSEQETTEQEQQLVYNQYAGQSIERIAALSDGIFAVAMTLLVLDLHVPVADTIHSDNDLGSALVALSPRLLTYFMSFLTLGIFWVGQQTQLNNYARSNRNLTWLQLGFLLSITVMPFSTSFLAEFIDSTYKIPLVFYWLNILLSGVMLFFSQRYAIRVKLVKESVTPAIQKMGERRIIIAQTLYLVGALLCIFHNYVSIGVIVLVQLNYVFAPRLPWLYRV